ncbi:hypothetical protein BDV97DRAFT_61730 [Delphinella strobiligena]|nr:hypothetical protein BDV97DRAFT_61730 [Delphinella strobiligena]
MSSNYNAQPSNPASEVVSPYWVPFTINIFPDAQEEPSSSEAKEQPIRPSSSASGESPLRSSDVDTNPNNSYFALLPASHRHDHLQYQPWPFGDHTRGHTTFIELAQTLPFRMIAAFSRGPARMIQPVADESLLASELDVSKLMHLYPWLWLAGKQIPPYPLHHQKVLSRDISVTERMDMHLVWTARTDMHLIPTSSWLYLKPMPRFLLDPHFCKDRLQCVDEASCKSSSSPEPRRSRLYFESQRCGRCRARRCATGFLLSYAALVSHESDFFISQHHHLLPQEMTWPRWKTFLQQLFADPYIYERIDPRFDYGELELSRLHSISRYHSIIGIMTLHAPITSIRGYNHGYNLYSEPLVVSITVYVALVLTAMQVGVATNQLKDNNTFHAASYGFAVLSIIAPLVIAAILYATFITFTGFSLLALSALNSSVAMMREWKGIERMEEQVHGVHREPQTSPEQTQPPTASSPPV